MVKDSNRDNFSDLHQGEFEGNALYAIRVTEAGNLQRLIMWKLKCNESFAGTIKEMFDKKLESIKSDSPQHSQKSTQEADARHGDRILKALTRVKLYPSKGLAERVEAKYDELNRDNGARSDRNLAQEDWRTRTTPLANGFRAMAK